MTEIAQPRRMLNRWVRKAAEDELFADAETTMEAIEDEIAEGLGLAGFCKKQNVRYRKILDWLLSDVDRARRYQGAERARASMAAEAATAVARKMAAPDRETGVDWIDDTETGMNPKAARVALEGLKWSATVGDQVRFGKTVRHEHSMSAEHLQALKARVASRTGLPPPIAALPPPIDGEFVVSRAMPVADAVAAALRIRVPGVDQ